VPYVSHMCAVCVTHVCHTVLLYAWHMRDTSTCTCARCVTVCAVKHMCDIGIWVSYRLVVCGTICVTHMCVCHIYDMCVPYIWYVCAISVRRVRQHRLVIWVAYVWQICTICLPYVWRHSSACAAWPTHTSDPFMWVARSIYTCVSAASSLCPQSATTHCNTLQYCNTRHHTFKLQLAAPHCTTLRHTAPPHCDAPALQPHPRLLFAQPLLQRHLQSLLPPDSDGGDGDTSQWSSCSVRTRWDAYTFIHVYTYMLIFMKYMYIYIHIYMNIYRYINRYMDTQIYRNIVIYIHTYTHIHEYI